MMRFSVVVPVYNVEKYIRACIESILRQTYVDFEIILVNDGSTDKSLEICRYYESIDNRVVAIDKVNGGATSARKTGATMAKGEYIVCIDGDDCIPETLLKRVSEKIECYPNLDVITFGYNQFRESTSENDVTMNGCCEGYYSDKAIHDLKSKYIYDSTNKGLNNGCILYGHPLKIIKKSLFVESIGLVPEHLKNGEDILFTALVLEKSSAVFVIDEILYHYRKNDKSLTSVRNPFDLVNIRNVYNCLRCVSYLSDDICKIYYYRSALIILSDMAKNSKNYKVFKKIIEENYCPMEKISFKYFTKTRLGVKSVIKLELIMNRKYYLVYKLALIGLI